MKFLPMLANGLRCALRTGAAISVFALCACTTSANYRLGKSGTPRAEALNYSSNTDTLALTLGSVIVNKGPGSWKETALWDEYVLSLRNTSAAPLRIESAALVDMLGVQQSPGTEPWELEKRSEANWKKYERVGLLILDAAGVASSVMLPSLSYGLTGVASGIMIAIPVVAVSTVAVVSVLDRENKAAVEQQFESRQLKLPLELAAGARVEGSLFFPVVPGPQRLIVQARGRDESVLLELELKPLAGLHLQPAKP